MNVQGMRRSLLVTTMVLLSYGSDLPGKGTRAGIGVVSSMSSGGVVELEGDPSTLEGDNINHPPGRSRQHHVQV